MYRASENGFGFEDFHAKCAGHKKCLTIIKSDSGNVFGGYTDTRWNESKSWIPDNKAFLFSLINKDSNPVKIKCSRSFSAVSSGSWIQQYGHDLYLSSNSNVITESWSNLGFAYKHPSYVYDSTQAGEFLPGSEFFKTLEIEMYIKQ